MYVCTSMHWDEVRDEVAFNSPQACICSVIFTPPLMHLTFLSRTPPGNSQSPHTQVHTWMSGARQVDTLRCTLSDGVPSTSSSVWTMALRLGSSGGRWRARVPKNTTTPSRTRSYLERESKEFIRIW